MDECGIFENAYDLALLSFDTGEKGTAFEAAMRNHLFSKSSTQYHALTATRAFLDAYIRVNINQRDFNVS